MCNQSLKTKTYKNWVGCSVRKASGEIHDHGVYVPFGTFELTDLFDCVEFSSMKPLCKLFGLTFLCVRLLAFLF